MTAPTTGHFRIFGSASYNVKARPVAVTPFADVTIPSHHYESLGHSAAGLDLRVLAVGVSAGGFIEAVLPGMYFETEFSHAIVEEVVGIRPNRTRFDSEIGYFVTPRFAIRFSKALSIRTMASIRICQ